MSQAISEKQPLRVGFLFYSGAGNTACVAEVFRGVFSRRADCTVVFFERITRRLDVRRLADFDLLGIGFPVYFRSTPAVIFDAIEQIEGRSRRVFTFCTKGLYSGNISREVLLRCRAVGLRPAGWAEMRMPGTDALLLFAKKGSVTERLIRKMHSRHIAQRVTRWVEDVLNTDSQSEEVPSVKWYTPIENQIVKPLERWVTKDYRVLRQGYQVLNDRCRGCLLCVEECPESNIVFHEGRFVFGNRCDLCLRCIHHCPGEAIQIGARTLSTSRYHPQVREDLEIIY